MADLRWGLTLPFAGVRLADHGPLLQRAEAAGYDDVWSGETANGYDGFTPLALAAAHTERTSSPFSASAGSWISAATGSPSRSTTVAALSPPGSGSASGRPPAST